MDLWFFILLCLFYYFIFCTMIFKNFIVLYYILITFTSLFLEFLVLLVKSENQKKLLLLKTKSVDCGNALAGLFTCRPREPSKRGVPKIGKSSSGDNGWRWQKLPICSILRAPPKTTLPDTPSIYTLQAHEAGTRTVENVTNFIFFNSIYFSFVVFFCFLFYFL